MLSDMRRPGLTRREILGGSVLLGVLVACTSDPSPGPTATTSAPGPDPDAAVRADVAQQEADLIALYDATVTAHPDLTESLAVIRAEHAAHAEAMGVGATAATPASVASVRGQALADLIAAEQQAVALRTAACEACAESDLARITALIAASEAGHAEFLRGVR